MVETVSIIRLDVKEVAEGVRASTLIGSSVRNASDEKIGTIDELMINRNQVVYAILQVGGFLGIGGYLVAVPFESLKITPVDIVLPGATKEELGSLPQFIYPV
jgi:hypothetical protein